MADTKTRVRLSAAFFHFSNRKEFGTRAVEFAVSARSFKSSDTARFMHEAVLPLAVGSLAQVPWNGDLGPVFSFGHDDSLWHRGGV